LWLVPNQALNSLSETEIRSISTVIVKETNEPILRVIRESDGTVLVVTGDESTPLGGFGHHYYLKRRLWWWRIVGTSRWIS